MAKWYKDLYRRNLVDMHINDTSEEYLKEFSADEYFAYLKAAKIQGPMIYLQAHTGLCYYPTNVSKTHAFFNKNPDEIKKLIKLCKDDGMKVVGYYSLIFNNQAVYDHPEWEMINSDGTTWRDHGQRYGLACPNNEEYRKFVIQNIKELAETYDNLDGIFYDMPYWEVTCHCPSCKKKWNELYNEEMPSEVDWNNQSWRNYVALRQKMMGEFTKFVRETSESILKGVTVEFNFAAVVGCDWLAGSTELINEESEFTGGDLYGDLYNHSFTAKYYYGITKNQPFEYMTCRCNKNLREHTVSKNEITLESEIMLSCMHHGASLIIDAINPDGTLDIRVAERIGKVFEKQIPYEPYMNRGELHSEVAVYFDSATQFPNNGKAYNKQCVIQTVKTLIENHIPVSVIANKHLDNLSKYQVIVAPALDNFNNPEIGKFVEYVKNGGTLYLSGSSDARLLKEFFDGKIIGETYDNSEFKHVYKGYDEVQCYICPLTDKYKQAFGEFNEKYPMPIPYKLPIIKATKGVQCASVTLPYTDPDNNTVFASIHSNPPGVNTDIPAILEVEYGKGKVIYTAATIENDPRYNLKDIFIKTIKPSINLLFEVETSKYVESIVFEEEKGYFLNLFDLNFALDVVDRPFKVKLPSGEFKVRELPSNKEIEINNNVIQGHFEKYLSLYVEKK